MCSCDRVFDYERTAPSNEIKLNEKKPKSQNLGTDAIISRGFAFC